MSRDQSVTSPSSHSLLSVSGDWRDGGSLSHDGQLFSHLARRRSKEDAAEAKQMESHQAEERTSPLPPDADMKTTLEWLRKEMMAMRSQDQQLFREFMKIRAGIQSLKAQEGLSPLSSRSSTPDPSMMMSDVDRSMSPAAAPRPKRTVTFHVRSSPLPGSVLHTLTKADSQDALGSPNIKSPGISSPLLSPVRRSAAFSSADFGSRGHNRLRSSSLSLSNSGNDWDFISGNTKKDAEVFMSQLHRSMSAKPRGSLDTANLTAGRGMFHLPHRPARPTNSAPLQTVSPAYSRDPSGGAVAVVLDANEDSSEC